MKKNIILIIYIRGKNNKFIQTIFSIIFFFSSQPILKNK